MKARIVVIYIGLCCLWALLALRAGYLQFVPHTKLQSLQNRQFQTVVKLPARRGAILDKEGRDLAMSQPAYSLYADPKMIDEKKISAKKISKILGVGSDFIFAKIKDPNKRFVWIERMLEQDKVDRLKKLDIKGLAFVEEWKRVYPNEALFSQALGFVGGEGQALEGLEMQYDSILRGNEKKVSVRRDARGRPLIDDNLMFSENSEGQELRLTLDSELQFAVESELAEVVKEQDAESAVGIVLDVETSAIRAMASMPTFDINKFSKVSPELRRNRNVTDVLEPGSTLKTFVIATALKNKLVKPNTKFYCEKGSFRVGDKIIHEAETKEAFANLSVSEILAVSSNIGTAKIGFQIGDKNLKQGLLDFGFGAKTGIDLPGESRGIVQATPWRQHLLSNISFGHGISVTPLQIANAYASIANGGKLNRPYLVDSIRDLETGSVQQTKPTLIRQVLTPEDAMSMRMMLASVTAPGGTGTNARVNGFVVAGKTGTAQKSIPGGRGYLKGAYISSFAGFIPAANPKFVIYIAVDHPKKSYYGSQVAAPIFSKIASYAVRKEGMSPQILADKAQMPEDLKQIAADTAMMKSKKKNKREVQSVSSASRADAVSIPTQESISVVPNYRELTLREVLRRAQQQSLQLKVIGSQGFVKQVVPEPGTTLPDDKKITVIMSR